MLASFATRACDKLPYTTLCTDASLPHAYNRVGVLELHGLAHRLHAAGLLATA